MPGSRDGQSSKMLSESHGIVSGNIEQDQKFVEIGLSDPYEDDDFEIYFDRA